MAKIEIKNANLSPGKENTAILDSGSRPVWRVSDEDTEQTKTKKSLTC